MADNGRAKPDGTDPATSESLGQLWTEAMRALTQTGDASHDAVFRSAVRSISILLRPDVVGIGILNDTGEIETPALYQGGGFADPIRYVAAGTPCHEVHTQDDFQHFENVATRFPDDGFLKEIGAETYFGHLMRSADGETHGHIFAIYAGSEIPHGDVGTFMALVARWCARELDYMGLIEETRASEHRANLSLEEARTARNIGGDLLSMVNHEIRTPLNAIIGFSDMLKTLDFGPEPDRVRTYGAMINDSGRVLLRLLDRVIYAGGIADPATMACDGEVDAGALCETLRRSFLAQTVDGGRVEFEVRPSGERMVGDDDGLRRLLEELLDNSLKHTDADGHIHVLFESAGEDGSRITVSDGGPGIPGEEVSRLLLPFQQREIGFARGEIGAGLGLHLVQRVVLAHEGTIAIEQAADGGAIVIITLPRRGAA